MIVLGNEAKVEAPEGKRLEVWDTDEPSERGIDGIERMRLVRDDIAAMDEEMLAAQGLYRGSINGQLDYASRRALYEYQIANSINATGNLDGRTAQSLGIAVGVAAVVLLAPATPCVARHRIATSR